jgi:hypothetical protein
MSCAGLNPKTEVGRAGSGRDGAALSSAAFSGRNEPCSTPNSRGSKIPRLNGAVTAQRAIPTNFGFWVENPLAPQNQKRPEGHSGLFAKHSTEFTSVRGSSACPSVARRIL